MARLEKIHISQGLVSLLHICGVYNTLIAKKTKNATQNDAIALPSAMIAGRWVSLEPRVFYEYSAMLHDVLQVFHVHHDLPVFHNVL